MQTLHKILLTAHGATLDATPLPTTQEGSALLTELYRGHVNDYPRFFKMDLLSRLGFIASELLLKAEGAERFVERHDRAILLFNHSASQQADEAYEATIRPGENYFPSPAAFVYTLPNIVTGEIAIRNHYHGETNFILLPTPAPALMRQLTATLWTDPTTHSALTGWIDAPDEQHFTAELQIIQRYGTERRTQEQDY